MITKNGVFVPDYLEYKVGRALFLTLDIVAAAPLQRPLLGSAVERKSLEDASKVIDRFVNLALRSFLGRHWRKMKDASYSFIAAPEVRAKDGTTRPLHFHGLLDIEAFDRFPAHEINTRLHKAWDAVAKCHLGYTPKLFIEPLREPPKAIEYITKHVRPRSNFEEAMIIKSPRLISRCRVARSETGQAFMSA